MTVVEATAPTKAAPATGAKSDGADEAESLLDRAQKFYQASALAEGHEAELGEAQSLLEQAGEILETLPEDNPRTRELRTRWSQLQQDVTRASGF